MDGVAPRKLELFGTSWYCLELEKTRKSDIVVSSGVTDRE